MAVYEEFSQNYLSKAPLKIFLTDNHYITIYKLVRTEYSSYRVEAQSMWGFEDIEFPFSRHICLFSVLDLYYIWLAKHEKESKNYIVLCA